METPASAMRGTAIQPMIDIRTTSAQVNMLSSFYILHLIDQPQHLNHLPLKRTNFGHILLTSPGSWYSRRCDLAQTICPNTLVNQAKPPLHQPTAMTLAFATEHQKTALHFCYLKRDKSLK